MAEESIFYPGLSPGPGLDNVNNGREIETGVLFAPDVGGTIVGFRQFMPASQAGGAIGKLYSWTSNSAGTLLADKLYDGPTEIIEGAWSTTLLDEANWVTVSAGDLLVTTTDFPQGHYTAIAGGLASDVSNGSHLTAPADGTGGRQNGKFRDPGPGYPDSTFGHNLYLADVIFVPDSAAQGAVDFGSVTLVTLAPTAIREGSLAVAVTGALGLTARAIRQGAVDMPGAVTLGLAGRRVRQGAAVFGAAGQLGLDPTRTTVTPSRPVAGGSSDQLVAGPVEVPTRIIAS